MLTSDNPPQSVNNKIINPSYTTCSPVYIDKKRPSSPSRVKSFSRSTAQQQLHYGLLTINHRNSQQKEIIALLCRKQTQLLMSCNRV